MASGAQAPGRGPLAVIPFASAGASEPEVSAAADRMYEELLRIGGFPLADPGAVTAAFASRKAQSDGCASVECAAGVARAVGAARFVTGKITRFDETHWLVSAQLLEGESPKPLRATSLQYTGPFFDFVREGIPFLAARIAGTRPKESRALATRLTETLYVEPGTHPPDAGQDAAAVSRESVRRRGFGAFTGYAQHGGTIHPKSGGSVSYSGGGVPNLGVDYQFELQPDLTLAPYFLAGGGSVSGGISDFYDSVVADELGVEVRTWWDTVYAGARVAFYGLGFTDSTDRKNDPFTLGGLSLGVSGGIEAASGAFVGVAADFASFASAKAAKVRPNAATLRVPVEGKGQGYSAWFMLGYRWK